MEELIQIFTMGMFLFVFAWSFRAADKIEKRMINSKDYFHPHFGRSEK